MFLSAWACGLEWLLAAAWVGRVGDALLHLRQVPDLCSHSPVELDVSRVTSEAAYPEITVIVPALNEAAAITACLRSLLASQGVRLQIFAVNDRSTDNTGALMEAVALEARAGLHTMVVLHVEALPPGWLGKPHALALGASRAVAPLLLFTDADAFYAPDALARCLRLFAVELADHLVLLPTPILENRGERMMFGMIQAYGLFGVRLWKVADPHARDSIGIGCFNLLRREAYEGIGGFEAMRMEVVEDLRLGYLVKLRGFRQRVAFGADLLRLHWAPGALGIVGVLEKNFFAICRYQVFVLLAGMAGTALLTLAPFAGLFGPWVVRVPAIVTLVTIATVYVANARRTRIPVGYALLFPVASCLILYAMARSAAITLARGGVSWRGTFYPLAELRSQAGKLWWWQRPLREFARGGKSANRPS